MVDNSKFLDDKSINDNFSFNEEIKTDFQMDENLETLGIVF